jgi:hypothetical protein
MPRNASTTRGPLLSFDPVGALMAATLTPQTCLALPTQREEPHEFPAVALCERADTEGRSVPHAGLGDAVIECLLTSRELAELLGFSAACVQDRFKAGGSTRPHQPLDSNLFPVQAEGSATGTRCADRPLPANQFTSFGPNPFSEGEQATGAEFRSQ